MKLALFWWRKKTKKLTFRVNEGEWQWGRGLFWGSFGGFMRLYWGCCGGPLGIN